MPLLCCALPRQTLDTALLERMGLDSKVVWAQVQSSVARLAANNAHNAMSMLSELRVDYLRARATIESGECVLAALPDGSEVRIQTGRILMATGSKPLRPESVPFDDKRVFDSDSIAHLAFLPRSVVVAGAGIIAIECACCHSCARRACRAQSAHPFACRAAHARHAATRAASCCARA